MDRFIEKDTEQDGYAGVKFKIQYGQIYSRWKCKVRKCRFSLKSNMDRFIVLAKLDE